MHKTMFYPVTFHIVDVYRFITLTCFGENVTSMNSIFINTHLVKSFQKLYV